ncbi:RadC family protein [Fluviicola taffensis]|uniref:DNA repair protein RadC n=1 Tax=Fluviicola taffensis (strain DSM 16823 / NCIMB 13979 / RW262) TaxID=755732 RepID=F2IKK1_FLUTR|nr:DNA repair protein RadC [Fluviicola taffensis]AEA45127.1 DNA repair protein RadC [Fluviicola taffensis DSM 16823]
MIQKQLSIRNWAEDDRPREKMILKGKSVLSDAELIAILIGTGSGDKSAVDLGRELLSLSDGCLYEFGKLRLSQLCEVKGIGRSKAISILAALELGRRRKELRADKKPKIDSVQKAYEELKGYFTDLTHEEFYILYLNNSNEILQVKQLSIGGITGTFVDPKIIFKHGIDLSACGIILAHNHPSGILIPSDQDKRLTKRIQQFGMLIEMNVIDHLIITDNGYFSFADQNLL